MNLTNVQREAPTFKTETGEIVTLTDAKGEQYFRELKAEIIPVQSGSGDPSPDNVRPITGWSEAKVTRTGKNLLDMDAMYATLISETLTRNAVAIRKVGTYTVSGAVPSGTARYNYARILKADGTWDAYKRVVADTSVTPQTFTLSEGDTLFVYDTQYNSLAVSKQVFLDCKMQIELGSTATDYEPYQGEEVTVQLGQTVYGGTLDVRRGKVRVTHQILDFSTVTWTAQTRSRWFYNGLQSTIKKPASTAVVTTAISDTFPSVSNDSIYSDETLIALAINNNGSVVVRNGSTTEQPTGHMVYELATPFDITVTTEAIKTLIGENNVWADTGEVTVTYKTDGTQTLTLASPLGANLWSLRPSVTEAEEIIEESEDPENGANLSTESEVQNGETEME